MGFPSLCMFTRGHPTSGTPEIRPQPTVQGSSTANALVLGIWQSWVAGIDGYRWILMHILDIYYIYLYIVTRYMKGGFLSIRHLMGFLGLSDN